MKNKLISLIVSAAIAISTLAGCGAPAKDTATVSSAASSSESISTEASSGSIQITDADGKQFTFDKPITKAVVYDRYNTEVFRAVGAYDTMIGVDQQAVDTYPQYWQGINSKIQIVGESCTDFNVEKIAALKPDAVFTSTLGEYDSMREQLKQFNIPVIAINAWKPSEYYDYITLVGKVTGHSEQADKFIKLCKDSMQAVNDGLKNIPESKRKTVYFENGGQYKTCLKGSGWFDMIQSAGGLPLFSDINFDTADQSKGNTSSYEVDPEAIISANPDVMIENVYTTAEHSSDEALEAPITLSDNEMEKELSTFVDRTGWDQLNAVKNKQVYGFTSFLGNANSKLIAIMYIAKWLYPDEFKDLDPDGFFKQWCDYMGFDDFTGYTAQLQ